MSRPPRSRASSDSRPVPVVEVADRLHSAAIHLLRRVRRQDAAAGLSPARGSALSVLVFAGPTTLGRLAEAEQVSAPTITRLVAGLERDGLLRRVPDPNDRRVTWLHPTPKGVRLLQHGRRRRIEDLTGRLSSLTPAELHVLEQAAALIERIAAGE